MKIAGKHLTLEEADALVRILEANGCDTANARAVANTIMAAERDICHSHGVFRLPGFVASLKSGKVDGKASPTIEKTAPGVLRIDSHGGFAPLPQFDQRPSRSAGNVRPIGDLYPYRHPGGG